MIFVHPVAPLFGGVKYCHGSCYNKPRTGKKAKYSTVCPRCREPLSINTEIESYRGSQWAHKGCLQVSGHLNPSQLAMMAQNALVVNHPIADDSRTLSFEINKRAAFEDSSSSHSSSFMTPPRPVKVNYYITQLAIL